MAIFLKGQCWETGVLIETVELELQALQIDSFFLINLVPTDPTCCPNSSADHSFIPHSTFIEHLDDREIMFPYSWGIHEIYTFIKQ